ncbi:hypothetical protein BDP27DRAFT_1402762 [Rhodocollybia butyracea]|uniref:Uncharacterized protein n=1 Tax=Rhodocollybia butyracea TaxID=206335 RepID=A0A9P5U6W5_9AGAR|nr:hypothetical protein BDP27DRAFT_1402762 [Rhodocollybia butyracea]
MNVLDPQTSPVEEPHVLRSASSNSSIGSSASRASLSRRPRARARSKTLTSSSTPQPADFISDVKFVQEPVSMTTEEANMANTGAAKGSEADLIRMSRAAKQASNLPSISTAPSAFSRVPLSQIDADSGIKVNIRDSVITQETNNSSSIYPFSTVASSTPVPHSPAESVFEMQQPPMVKSFDEDDVSYRLRLLVNNNYFLPPAHSKPHPDQFHASPVPVNGNSTLPKKPPTPTFLDLFRLGKNKSKPSTPTSEPGTPLVPALRTTSDATAVSGFPLPPTGPQSTPQVSTSSGGRPAASRVVVVREKMLDLESAAKQAELEMKSRRGREPAIFVDDVIDPTDAVDLPPPSTAYPFTVQASALHGLGVNDSVGAAILADHLPPPKSSSSQLVLDEDAAWRKALLHAAVGHSFDNLADASLSRHVASLTSGASSMLSAPIASGSGSIPPSPAVSTAKINRKIISGPISLNSSPRSRSKSQPPSRPRGFSSASASSTSHLYSANPHPPTSPSPIPFRTETPSEPLKPLMPPPKSPLKRQLINPLYSLSQTDLTEPAEPVAEAETNFVVPAIAEKVNPGSGSRSMKTANKPAGSSSPSRKSTSSNRNGRSGSSTSKKASSLSSEPRVTVPSLTPPPFPRESSESNMSGVETGLPNTEDEDGDARSIYSIMTAEMGSESEGSQDFGEGQDDRGRSRSRSRASVTSTYTAALSPTTSAFQDALSRNPSELHVNVNDTDSNLDSQTQSNLRRIHVHHEQDRNLLTSPTPPPRISSDPVLQPLSPAPRPPRTPRTTTSLHYRDMRNRQFEKVPSVYSLRSTTPTSVSGPAPPSPSSITRSTSDQGHGTPTKLTLPPPVSKRRPPTAPAAPNTDVIPNVGYGRVEIIEIAAPGPVTPPFLESLPRPSPDPLASLLERRSRFSSTNANSGRDPLSLHIPTTMFVPSIRSAPAPQSPPSLASSFDALRVGRRNIRPASPTSRSFVDVETAHASASASNSNSNRKRETYNFFDKLQSQPNALDYLDNSEESSEEEDYGDVKDDGEVNGSGSGSEGGSKSGDDGGETAGRKTLSVAHSTHSAVSILSTPSAPSSTAFYSTRSPSRGHTPVSSLMRLGNHSTPHVSSGSRNALGDDLGDLDHNIFFRRSGDQLQVLPPLPTRPTQSFQSSSKVKLLPFGVTDPKRPIGHIPPSPSKSKFFNKKIRAQQLPLELYQYRSDGRLSADAGNGSGAAQSLHDRHSTEALSTITARPRTTSSATSPGRNLGGRYEYEHDHAHDKRPSTSTATVRSGHHKKHSSGLGKLSKRQQESEKLDGMVKLHLEAEKDRIKRMAERMMQHQGKGGGGAFAKGKSTR